MRSRLRVLCLSCALFAPYTATPQNDTRRVVRITAMRIVPNRVSLADVRRSRASCPEALVSIDVAPTPTTQEGPTLVIGIAKSYSTPPELGVDVFDGGSKATLSGPAVFHYSVCPEGVGKVVIVAAILGVGPEDRYRTLAPEEARLTAEFTVEP